MRNLSLLHPAYGEAFASSTLVHLAKSNIKQETLESKQLLKEAKARLAKDKSLLDRMNAQGGKPIDTPNQLNAILQNPLILGGIVIFIILMVRR